MNREQEDLQAAGQEYCDLHADEHCLTCGDIAVRVRVVGVDQTCNSALVETEEGMEEVDISLVETVEPGDLLLVHGGVAIAVEPGKVHLEHEVHDVH